MQQESYYPQLLPKDLKIYFLQFIKNDTPTLEKYFHLLKGEDAHYIDEIILKAGYTFPSYVLKIKAPSVINYIAKEYYPPKIFVTIVGNNFGTDKNFMQTYKDFFLYYINNRPECLAWEEIGRQILHYAIEQRVFDLARLIVEKASEYCQDPETRTSFKRFDLAEGYFGGTPLHATCRFASRGHFCADAKKIIENMLTLGVDINAKKTKEKPDTPLMISLREQATEKEFKERAEAAVYYNNHLELIQFLLHNKADPSVTYDDTPEEYTAIDFVEKQFYLKAQNVEIHEEFKKYKEELLSMLKNNMPPQGHCILQ